MHTCARHLPGCPPPSPPQISLICLQSIFIELIYIPLSEYRVITGCIILEI